MYRFACFLTLLAIFAIAETASHYHEQQRTLVNGTNLKVKALGFKSWKNIGPLPTAQNIIKIITNLATTIGSPTICGKHCLNTPGCCGFYYRIHEFCKLVNTSRTRAKSVVDIGTDYYEIISQCTKNKTICGNGECVPNFQNNSFSCKHKPPPQGIVCQTKSTTWNDDGGGGVIFLDRHSLDCDEHSMMKSFVLEKDTPSRKIRYNYVCCNTPYPCSKVDKETTLNARGGANFLDRHGPTCYGQYISSFQLLNRNPNMKYKYSCCNSNSVNLCYASSTSWTPNGGGNGKTTFLDKQEVSCDADYGIVFFKLEVDHDNEKFRYNYECCKEVID